MFFNLYKSIFIHSYCYLFWFIKVSGFKMRLGTSLDNFKMNWVLEFVDLFLT